ncbi:hypothetical protein QFZ66_007257 [Streptomyces sp. B4I13]|nr:hypothetical protein [Streptomyces sp. B4I13]
MVADVELSADQCAVDCRVAVLDSCRASFMCRLVSVMSWLVNAMSRRVSVVAIRTPAGSRANRFSTCRVAQRAPNATACVNARVNQAR